MKYLLIFCFALFSQITQAQNYTNIIIFGDSLSDIGNNTWVSVPGRGAAFANGAPISNLDPRTNLPTIWPQYLIEIGFLPIKTIIASQQWHQENLNATNIVYAYASAETGANYVNDEASPFTYPQNCVTAGLINAHQSCVPNLQQQVKTYLANLQQLHEQPSDNTIYVIWAGGNDIFDNISRLIYRISHAKANWHLLLPQKELAFSWFPSVKILTATNLLIHAGVPADHIYVITLPNISITPGAVSLITNALPDKPKMQTFALNVLSGLTHLFNFDLRFGLYIDAWKINQPFTRPHVLDVNQFLTKIIDTRSIDGVALPHITNSCVAEHATPYCKGYLFFNDKHPTTEVGQALASDLYNDIKAS